MTEKIIARIESESEIAAYIQDLKYALEHGAHLTFQEQRRVDDNRNICHTNKYAVAALFPGENPAEALRRELKQLSAEDYLRTVKDIRFPKRSEMREFGKVYDGIGDVYIKIRVELLDSLGAHTVFVMSFHFAEQSFSKEMFPYSKKEEA